MDNAVAPNLQPGTGTTVPSVPAVPAPKPAPAPGGTGTGAGTAPGATFPVQVEQADNVTPADIHADTSVTLYADGRIVVNTSAYEWTDLHGGHVGVVVLLYQDGSPPFWLWTSNAVRYGLDGKWIGPSQITTSFTQTVDPDTMSRVKYAVIKHYNAPNDAWQDIQPWLQAAQQAFSFVAALAKPIK